MGFRELGSGGLLVQHGAVADRRGAAVELRRDLRPAAASVSPRKDRTPLGRAAPHELRPRGLPVLHALGERAHEQDLLAGPQVSKQRRQHLVGLRPLRACRARRPSPCGAGRSIGPIVSAYLQPAGHVVPDERRLLGLADEHEVAGSHLRADLGADVAHVALVAVDVLRRVDPEDARARERDEPELAGARESPSAISSTSGPTIAAK